jgi:hypothetical protein
MAAIEFFSDPDICLELVSAAKWGKQAPLFPSALRFGCRFSERAACGRALTAGNNSASRSGTIFEDSAMPLNKWFCATWMLGNCKNGVSSYEIARAFQ